MRAGSAMLTMSTAIDIPAGDIATLDALTDANCSRHSVASRSECVGHLVRSAVLVLDSDHEAARKYLNDALALLECTSERQRPETNRALRSSGLPRWQGKRALAYIEDNLGSKLDTRGLADLLAFSKSHFCRAFKRSFGVPPMTYVAARRVERAKLMMSSTTDRLTNIALACGFADQPHLNKLFRRMVGVSPGVWRRANAKAVNSYSQPRKYASKRPFQAATARLRVNQISPMRHR